ncbi:MAG: nuclease [Acidobacteria bacterium]|nr:nuclease [Acidobacteriota bacterium]MBI3421995.1 nuclease [Acidobacteriota bacterium]
MTELNGHIKLIVLVTTVALAVIALRLPRDVWAWGHVGHELAGRAAAIKLPVDMPKFFRKEVDQLSYLNPEPDRWRARDESNIDRGMDSAAAPDHFIDLELVPATALNAVNRYDFTAELLKAGKKPVNVGFVPYRMLELFQTMRIEFRLWRAEKDARKRRWIEARILNDAGILGHYVTDAANPHHTTIHYNGWSGDNPQGYTVFTSEPNKGIHYRFEDVYLESHIKLNDVLPLIAVEARVIEKPREAIWEHLRNSNKLVEQLYILDKQEAFSATTAGAEHKKFISERLAAGAQMLRDLWWTAWVTSDPKLTPPVPPRPTN